MVNKVILLGYVGQDPEDRALESGAQVVNFSLATSKSYKNKQGEKVKETEWHSCQAWGALVDIIMKYVSKGDKLYVEGEIKTRNWVDKETQNKVYKTEIVVRNIQLMGDSGGSSGNNSGTATASNRPSPAIDEDDLPF